MPGLNGVAITEEALNVYLTNGGGGGTASDFDVAFPAAGTAAGAQDTTTGEMVPLESTDGLLQVGGSLSVAPVASDALNVNSLGSPGTIGATGSANNFLAANSNRKSVVMQNVGTTNIYVLLDPSGTAAASATNFTFILRAGGTSKDGSSPISQLTLNWQGAISVCSSAAGGLIAGGEFV